MSAMTEDQTYNGWKNYPTWAVNLWLSNDEGLAADVQNIIVEIGADDEDNTRRVDVADAIKDFVNEITPDLGASFAADLLGYALDSVDWFEIADAWLED